MAGVSGVNSTHGRNSVCETKVDRPRLISASLPPSNALAGFPTPVALLQIELEIRIGALSFP